MSDYNRPAKAVSGDGGTSYVDGNTLTASELNDEFDAIQAVINGGIDESNFSGSIAIPNADLVDIAMTKVLDLADDAATYKGTNTPGDSGTPSLPTTLAAEVTRMRYRIGANNRYWSNVFYMNASAVATSISWIEPPIVGPNLLPNAGFEVHTGSATAAPDGWTLVGTPSNVAIENPAHTGTGLEKRSLNIVTDAANEGISVAVAGLKTGVKYLVGMAYSITNNGTSPGTIRLTTTNGLATGEYQNLVLTDGIEAASTVSVLQGLVKPTATPATMTITISATESGADWNLHEVWMYEVSDGKPSELPHIPTQVELYTTADDTLTNSGAGAWSNRADLSISQYIPYRGYRLRYQVTLCFKSTTGGGTTDQTEYAFRIQQNIDAGGATTVEGPYAWRTTYTTSGSFSGGTVNMEYVIENPTPGSTYAFTTDAYTEGSSNGVNTIIFNPTVATALATQSRARLIVERI